MALTARETAAETPGTSRKTAGGMVTRTAPPRTRTTPARTRTTPAGAARTAAARREDRPQDLLSQRRTRITTRVALVVVFGFWPAVLRAAQRRREDTVRESTRLSGQGSRLVRVGVQCLARCLESLLRIVEGRTHGEVHRTASPLHVTLCARQRGLGQSHLGTGGRPRPLVVVPLGTQGRKRGVEVRLRAAQMLESRQRIAVVEQRRLPIRDGCVSVTDERVEDG